jgi:hypothetical protein
MRKEAKSFVGFAGFYRQFIKAFSRLTKPLSAENYFSRNQEDETSSTETSNGQKNVRRLLII